MKYAVTVSGQTPREIELSEAQDGLFAQLGDQRHHLDMACIDGGGFYSLLVDERSYQVFVEEREDDYAVVIQGRLYEVLVENEQARRARGLRGRPAAAGRALIKSPMPGLVVDVTVREGDEVAAGQRLITLEAMKMENEIRAPAAGRVQRVHVAVGDSVMQGQALVLLSESETGGNHESEN